MGFDRGAHGAGHIELGLDEPDALSRVAHALSSQVRISILRLLTRRSMNVNEISGALGIPPSTAALNVRVLEEAGLIGSALQPGVRGAMKLCSAKVEGVCISLREQYAGDAALADMSLNVGCYSLCSALPACGLAAEFGLVGDADAPRVFYDPRRLSAQVLWLHEGFLEYHFSNVLAKGAPLRFIEISFEACAYAPHRGGGLCVQLNGVTLGTWQAGEGGYDRPGRLTPGWWEGAPQYGGLARWRVGEQGTTLNGLAVGHARLSDIESGSADSLALRISTKKDAAGSGGIYLFGEKFGDYAQGIRLWLG